MRKSTRQAAKTAAKARLSGAIPSSDAQKNKKIVFADDASYEDENQRSREEDDNFDPEYGGKRSEVIVQVDNEEIDDENVEEVTGIVARELTQKLRDDERKIAKYSAASKKKRKKHVDVAKEKNDEGSEEYEDENDDENDDDMLTDDFLKVVDSERADQFQKAKQEKKNRKLKEKKRLGKHTTFVAEGDYNIIDAPQQISQNIEVVALGMETDGTVDEHGRRQHLISATLGTAPSKATILFARGSLSSGTPKARGSGGRKRTSKKEETWKRSRKMNSLVARSRPGNAAAFFVRRK